VSTWLDLYAWRGDSYPAGAERLSPSVPVCPRPATVVSPRKRVLGAWHHALMSCSRCTCLPAEHTDEAPIFVTLIDRFTQVIPRKCGQVRQICSTSKVSISENGCWHHGPAVGGVPRDSVGPIRCWYAARPAESLPSLGLGYPSRLPANPLRSL
jgi:hypothetical protein